MVLPPGIHISARFAAQLVQMTNLRTVQVRRRGADAEFDREALEVRKAAAWYRSQLGSDQVPTSGSDAWSSSEPVARLECTTSEAADRLGISVRAVVKAIHGHRLPARQDPGSRRWRLRVDDVERLRTEETKIMGTEITSEDR